MVTLQRAWVVLSPGQDLSPSDPNLEGVLSAQARDFPAGGLRDLKERRKG